MAGKHVARIVGSPTLPPSAERLARRTTSHKVDAFGYARPVNRAHVPLAHVPIGNQRVAVGLIFAQRVARPLIPLDHGLAMKTREFTTEGKPSGPGEQFHAPHGWQSRGGGPTILEASPLYRERLLAHLSPITSLPSAVSPANQLAGSRARCQPCCRNGCSTSTVCQRFRVTGVDCAANGTARR